MKINQQKLKINKSTTPNMLDAIFGVNDITMLYQGLNANTNP